MRRKCGSNIYNKKDEDDNISLISLYVDDLIITCNASNLMKEIKSKFS